MKCVYPRETQDQVSLTPVDLYQKENGQRVVSRHDCMEVTYPCLPGAAEITEHYPESLMSLTTVPRVCLHPMPIAEKRLKMHLADPMVLHVLCPHNRIGPKEVFLHCRV